MHRSTGKLPGHWGAGVCGDNGQNRGRKDETQIQSLSPLWPGSAWALPAFCQVTELFSPFMGSCRNPRNQVWGAALCKLLKPTTLVCSAFHFLTFYNFPHLIPASALKWDCLVAFLGKPRQWEELRRCQPDLAHLTFPAHCAWMVHCSCAELSFRKWLSDVRFPFWYCFTLLPFIT